MYAFTGCSTEQALICHSFPVGRADPDASAVSIAQSLFEPVLALAGFTTSSLYQHCCSLFAAFVIAPSVCGLLCRAPSLQPLQCEVLIVCVAPSSLPVRFNVRGSLGLHRMPPLLVTPTCLVSWTLCLLHHLPPLLVEKVWLMPVVVWRTP